MSALPPLAGQGPKHRSGPSGDLIELGACTFFERELNLNNKNITLRGQGPDATIIDGDNVGGAILSRIEPFSIERMELPLEDKGIIGVKQKHHLLIVRYYVAYMLEELVIVNVHLSAFDENAATRRKQLKTLNEFIRKEYKAGNYVICGGEITIVSKHFIPLMEAIPVFSDAELRKITAPIQFFGGDHDALIDSVKTGERLKSILPHSDIHILKDTGHVIVDQFENIKYFLITN